MKTHLTYRFHTRSRESTNRHSSKLYMLFAFTLLLAILLSCEKIEYGPEVIRQFGSETAIVQEISFKTKDFFIVGDLRYPLEGSRHPLIIMVHGSGGATRSGAINFVPMIEIFLRNGYAVLSWDKPGYGESEGELESGKTIFQRAGIIADAVEVLRENQNIDHSRIGLWGISQAGWVMPNALEKTDHIKFMIVVSGGGEDGIDQGAFQQGQMILCSGGSLEDATTVEQYWSEMNKAATYEEYRNAVEILLEVPWITANTPLFLQNEENWTPWPRDIDAFYDPMTTIRKFKIPILSFYGGKDRYVDPFQGADAYEAAFESSGNSQGQLCFIEDANHTMIEAETGCPDEAVDNHYMTEYLEIMEFWLMDF